MGNNHGTEKMNLSYSEDSRNQVSMSNQSWLCKEGGVENDPEYPRVWDWPRLFIVNTRMGRMLSEPAMSSFFDVLAND